MDRTTMAIIAMIQKLRKTILIGLEILTGLMQLRLFILLAIYMTTITCGLRGLSLQL